MVQAGWLTQELEQRRLAREREQLLHALHEGSHAVSARALYGEVTAVSLVARDGHFGITHLFGLKYRDHVVTNLASYAFAEAARWPDPHRGCQTDERQARQFAIMTVEVEGGDAAAVFADGLQRARVLVREHWAGIWSFAQILRKRIYLAGEDLDSALEAAIHLSPSQRAADRAWDAEFGAAMAFLDREHARCDLRERLLQGPPNKSPAALPATIIAPSVRSMRGAWGAFIRVR
jgi:hypothetical protein